MIDVSLKEIYQASFNRSEMTNYRVWKKTKHRELSNGEALCIVSMLGNQLVWVWKPLVIKAGMYETEREVFLSVRIRIDSKSAWWEPGMLQHYAEQVGLNLVGLKTYAEYWDE